MRIYVTEFTKLVGKDLKPVVVKSGFGDDFSASYKDFLIYLYFSLVPSLSDKLRFHFGMREFKLTITFKF